MTEVRFDAMRLVPAVWPGPGRCLAWRAGDPSGIEGYGSVVDTVPLAEVSDAGTPGPGTLDLAGLLPGLQYLHVRAWDRAGNVSATHHQPFVLAPLADATPPKVLELLPAPGSRSAADTILVRVGEAGSGIALASLDLEVAGEHFGFRDPEVCVSADSSTIRWRRQRPAAPQLPAFPDTTAVSCRVHFQDRAGNPLVETPAWSWTMDFAQDHEPPPAPCLSWHTDDTFIVEDFETGMGLCIGLREGWTALSRERAATGAASHARLDPGPTPPSTAP